MDEILDITLHVAGTLDRLGIPYLVVGSLASSLHGIPRATQDVDLVAQLRQRDVTGLVAALRETFYLDEAAIRDAVERRASFNLIHLRTLLKVDVFIAGDDEASRAQMQRRQQYELEGAPPRVLMVATAEDVVAQKLYWYRLGDEVSDRQWSDAVGVLRVSGPRLDLDYLRHAATLLGVEDLLRLALDEAAIIADEQ
ncbi:MAG: hypothetical protein L0271_25305 [Gemmatimonadetes bacterium]|nr:hypothetical protein [Gemmatimonadota bacterium]